MAITRKDLQREVDILNEKYCKRTSNHLVVNKSGLGYQVQLTGKPRKDGKGYRGMGTANSAITKGRNSARDTIKSLWNEEAQGEIKRRIKYREEHNKDLKPKKKK
ncbi:MAG: hypothetical protein ACI4MQ_01710 [Candidatus Coproplasma sp.]